MPVLRAQMTKAYIPVSYAYKNPTWKKNNRK